MVGSLCEGFTEWWVYCVVGSLCDGSLCGGYAVVCNVPTAARLRSLIN